MKTKKTPTAKRGTYKLFDDDGHFITEYKPGKDGVTEVDILNLHRMDDHEVYINNKDRWLPKDCMPMYEQMKAEFIEKFKEEHGREPRKNEIPKPHRQYISIDAQITPSGDDLGDSSRLEAELAVYDDVDDESDAVIRLKEIIAAMPEKWQQVYRLFYLEGHNKTQIGRMLGITDVRVGQLIKKIKAAIANDEILKKIYR